VSDCREEANTYRQKYNRSHDRAVCLARDFLCIVSFYTEVAHRAAISLELMVPAQLPNRAASGIDLPALPKITSPPSIDLFQAAH